MSGEIRAIDFARELGLDEKAFMAKLRQAFADHPNCARWIARRNSDEFAKWQVIAHEAKRVLPTSRHEIDREAHWSGWLNERAVTNHDTHPTASRT